MDGLQLPPDCADAVDRMGEEYLASIYGIAAKRHPDNVAVLAELGHVYTRLGRYQEGLAVDLRLVAFAPEDPTVRYNLACSQSLLGQVDEALETLRCALELGYDDVEFLRSDEDLARLRSDPRFEELLRLHE